MENGWRIGALLVKIVCIFLVVVLIIMFFKVGGICSDLS